MLYIETLFCGVLLNRSHANSINHEYKDWDEKNPQLTTCNQNTKNIVQGSTVPQEVDTDKEVVFTFDVTFKVLFSETLCNWKYLNFS